MATRTAGAGILAEENNDKREEIIGLLTKAYWMEIETVMSYMAGSVNPDGVRAQEIKESLAEDITEELGHAERFARRCWVVPILSGEFVIERRCGWADGLMGGNLWFFGASADAALDAATKAAGAASEVPGVILPFPGGVASSGSKAGSKYKFAIASTYAEYCPTLREKLGERSRVPEGVVSVQEIIINGRDLPTIVKATQAAITASVETPGLLKISAGNYGGRLGKSFVYLHPERQVA